MNNRVVYASLSQSVFKKPKLTKVAISCEVAEGRQLCFPWLSVGVMALFLPSHFEKVTFPRGWSWKVKTLSWVGHENLAECWHFDRHHWHSFTLSSPSDSESASYLLSKLSASYWLSASMKSLTNALGKLTSYFRWFEYECYEAGSDWVLSVCWKEVHCICKARFSLAVVGEVLWKFGCCRRGSVEVWLL